MSISQKRLRLLRPKEPEPTRPLLVFLPGMDGTGQLLGTQLDGLEAVFDIRCLSIPSDDLTGWSGLVEQTAALIQAEGRLGTTRPVYLCGESFGGCLALKLAAYSPELFDRMILVNPASSFSRQPAMGWGATFVQWLPDPLYRLSTVGLLPFLIAPERVDPQTRRKLLAAITGDKLSLYASCQGGLRGQLEEKFFRTALTVRKRSDNQLDIGFSFPFNNA